MGNSLLKKKCCCRKFLKLNIIPQEMEKVKINSSNQPTLRNALKSKKQKKKGGLQKKKIEKERFQSTRDDISENVTHSNIQQTQENSSIQQNSKRSSAYQRKNKIININSTQKEQNSAINYEEVNDDYQHHRNEMLDSQQSNLKGSQIQIFNTYYNIFSSPLNKASYNQQTQSASHSPQTKNRKFLANHYNIGLDSKNKDIYTNQNSPEREFICKNDNKYDQKNSKLRQEQGRSINISETSDKNKNKYNYKTKKVFSQDSDESYISFNRSYSVRTDLEARQQLSNESQTFQNEKIISSQFTNIGNDRYTYSPESLYALKINRNSKDSFSYSSQIKSYESQKISKVQNISFEDVNIDMDIKRDQIENLLLQLIHSNNESMNKSMQKQARKLKIEILQKSKSNEDFLRQHQSQIHVMNNKDTNNFLASLFFISQSLKSKDEEAIKSKNIYECVQQIRQTFQKQGKKYIYDTIKNDCLAILFDLLFKISKLSSRDNNLIQIIIKCIQQIVSCSSLMKQYFRSVTKLTVQLIDLIKWSLSINDREVASSLMQIFIQLSLGTTFRQNINVFKFISLNQILVALSKSILIAIQQKDFSQDSLFLIKSLTFIKVVLSALKTTENQPIYKGSTQQQLSQHMLVSTDIFQIPKLLNKLCQRSNGFSQSQLIIIDLSLEVLSQCMKFDLISTQILLLNDKNFQETNLQKQVFKKLMNMQEQEIYPSFIEFLSLINLYNRKVQLDYNDMITYIERNAHYNYNYSYQLLSSILLQEKQLTASLKKPTLEQMKSWLMLNMLNSKADITLQPELLDRSIQAIDILDENNKTVTLSHFVMETEESIQLTDSQSCMSMRSQQSTFTNAKIQYNIYDIFSPLHIQMIMQRIDNLLKEAVTDFKC